MSILPAALFDFDFFEPLPIQIEMSEAPLTSDAGLLPLRQFDERIGLTKQFATVLDDPRHPDLTKQTFLEIVRSPEANAQGTTGCFVVTNRAGASRYLEATYDEYVMRGTALFRPARPRRKCSIKFIRPFTGPGRTSIWKRAGCTEPIRQRGQDGSNQPSCPLFRGAC
jgi:hypothetical protein